MVEAERHATGRGNPQGERVRFEDAAAGAV